MTNEIYLTPTGHAKDCDWHVDQYPWECTCGFIPRKKSMDDLIAQDADLIDKLRDEDSYYRLQEKHWCIDGEELERQRLAAADRIEALEAALREVFEEWAGSEGFIPETAPEGYLLQLTKRMADIARAALAGNSHD